jgi:hypothetical protein
LFNDLLIRIAHIFSGSLFGKQDQNISNTSIQSNNSNRKPLTGPMSRGEIVNRSNDSVNSSRGMSFVGNMPDGSSDIDTYDRFLLNVILINLN